MIEAAGRLDAIDIEVDGGIGPDTVGRRRRRRRQRARRRQRPVPRPRRPRARRGRAAPARHRRRRRGLNRRDRRATTPRSCRHGCSSTARCSRAGCAGRSSRRSRPGIARPPCRAPSTTPATDGRSPSSTRRDGDVPGVLVDLDPTRPARRGPRPARRHRGHRRRPAPSRRRHHHRRRRRRGPTTGRARPPGCVGSAAGTRSTSGELLDARGDRRGQLDGSAHGAQPVVRALDRCRAAPRGRRRPRARPGTGRGTSPRCRSAGCRRRRGSCSRRRRRRRTRARHGATSGCRRRSRCSRRSAARNSSVGVKSAPSPVPKATRPPRSLVAVNRPGSCVRRPRCGVQERWPSRQRCQTTARSGRLAGMEDRLEPSQIEVARDEGVTVTFGDGYVARFDLLALRKGCPCATCRAHRDQGEAAWPRPGSPAAAAHRGRPPARGVGAGDHVERRPRHRHLPVRAAPALARGRHRARGGVTQEGRRAGAPCRSDLAPRHPGGDRANSWHESRPEPRTTRIPPRWG